MKDKIEKLEEPLFRSVPVLREPKLENSFIFEFPPNMGIESFMVQTAEKPNISLNESEEYEWHSMKVQILELTDNSTLKGVQKMLSNKNGFDCTLKDLDCCGVMLNEWLLTGCSIKDVDYGKLDYGSNNLSLITINIKPKKCTLK